MDQDSAGCALRGHLKLLLFVGLLLSETQLLVNLKAYFPPYNLPYCTLAFFILSTAHLVSVFARYALGGGREKGAILQWYQHLVLPCSVLLLSLLSKGSDMVQYKASCAVMLTLQSLLVAGKIIYFNSVTPELAQISTINKLVRVVKLNVIGLLPLVVQGQLVMVAVVALCQAISLCAFFLKFTYQKCLYEYVLLVCVFCGFVSAVQNVFQTIFTLSYFFIGQIAALFFYLHDTNYLKTLLELKYSTSLTNNSQSKQDDQVLAGLLFLQECLFENKRTLKLSESARNEGALHASAIMERIKANNHRFLEGEGSSCDLVFRTQSGERRQEVSTALFEVYCQRFHQTDSFSCFEFTVGSALQLGGGFTSKALVLYYSFMERKRAKASAFQQSKFHYIYQRILKQVEARQSDKQEINFIEFSDNLRMLGSEIEECLANEVKMVEQLADRSRKADMMTDVRIFARNKHKQVIRCRIEKCILQKIYFCSNQFKFLFLLYHISIEKRYLSLKDQLKHHFLASEVQQLRYADSQNSLIVLSGFNHGEIINSNEVFKNHFGLALSSFARSNISEFIPTEKQRAKHANLMAEAVESHRQQPTHPHSSYQCLLAIEKEMGSVKLKLVERFKIGVRIHYQNSGTFNYICSLAPFQDHKGGREKQTLTLLKRDCQNFTNKGIQLTIVENHTIEQLDEQLELTEIDFSYDSQGLHNSNNAIMRSIDRKERPVKTERYLQEKTVRIEMKMMEEGAEEYRCGWRNIIQIIAILFLAVFVLVMLRLMDRRLDNLKLSISQLVMPVAQAELVHSKILLEQEILSMQAQTPYFADSLCLKNHLPSISSYITNILLADLVVSSDEFLSAISLPHNFGPLGDNLYLRRFSSMPYLMNPLAKVSYQKHIQLMKSQTYSLLSQLRNKTFDYNFYSQIFPFILLDSTIDGPQTLTTLLQASQNDYITQLTSSLSELRAISLVLVGVLGALVVGLRLRDNLVLMSLLGIVECIPSEQLGQRIRELKSTISQLHQLRANRIQAIEFDHSFTVEIKKDKLQAEGVLVEDFAEWHMRDKTEYEMEDSQGSIGQLDKEFEHHRSRQPAFGKGQFIRLLKYKKVYLSISIGLLVCLMVLSDGAVDKQRGRLDTLVLCNAASLQLNIIQQKFINLAAYNWLKVLSLQQPDFDMAQANAMFAQATNSLLNSTYITKIPAAYSKELSDEVLYGDVCGYFNNRQACLYYRNNIFSSGLSMVIPFVVKEMIEIDKISSNYTYYLLNMCDKTWLLFDGIVPLTNNISAHGFKVMTALSEKGYLQSILQIAITTLVLLVATVVFQYRRYHRERIIREEVFSLDTVENLYAVTEFKPYFNSVYYS